MMRPDAKVEKVYLYPKPVDFRKSIDRLAALVEHTLGVLLYPRTAAGELAVLTGAGIVGG